MAFSYFGSKASLAHLYPKPKYGLIIEPFCGAAHYSCLRGIENDVWLNDLYPVIPTIWNWLKQATWNDINGLPNLEKGDDLRNIVSLSDPERMLLGFCVGRGRGAPGNVYTGWAARDNQISRFKKRFKPIVGKISHWKITNLDFRQVRYPTAATYFIDPPYQNRRSDYVVQTQTNFYAQLAIYCKCRKGQLIVCEGSGANWLDFDENRRSSVVKRMSQGQRRKMAELIKVIHNA